MGAYERFDASTSNSKIPSSTRPAANGSTSVNINNQQSGRAFKTLSSKPLSFTAGSNSKTSNSSASGEVPNKQESTRKVKASTSDSTLGKSIDGDARATEKVNNTNYQQSVLKKTDDHRFTFAAPPSRAGSIPHETRTGKSSSSTSSLTTKEANTSKPTKVNTTANATDRKRKASKASKGNDEDEDYDRYFSDASSASLPDMETIVRKKKLVKTGNEVDDTGFFDGNLAGQAYDNLQADVYDFDDYGNEDAHDYDAFFQHDTADVRMSAFNSNTNEVRIRDDSQPDKNAEDAAGPQQKSNGLSVPSKKSRLDNGDDPRNKVGNHNTLGRSASLASSRARPGSRSASSLGSADHRQHSNSPRPSSTRLNDNSRVLGSYNAANIANLDAMSHLRFPALPRKYAPSPKNRDVPLPETMRISSKMGVSDRAKHSYSALRESIAGRDQYEPMSESDEDDRDGRTERERSDGERAETDGSEGLHIGSHLTETYGDSHVNTSPPKVDASEGNEQAHDTWTTNVEHSSTNLTAPLHEASVSHDSSTLDNSNFDDIGKFVFQPVDEVHNQEEEILELRPGCACGDCFMPPEAQRDKYETQTFDEWIKEGQVYTEKIPQLLHRMLDLMRERNQQTDQLANKIDNHMLLVDQKQALYEGQKQKIRLWKIGPIGFGTPNA